MHLHSTPLYFSYKTDTNFTYTPANTAKQPAVLWWLQNGPLCFFLKQTKYVVNIGESLRNNFALVVMVYR